MTHTFVPTEHHTSCEYYTCAESMLALNRGCHHSAGNLLCAQHECRAKLLFTTACWSGVPNLWELRTSQLASYGIAMSACLLLTVLTTPSYGPSNPTALELHWPWRLLRVNLPALICTCSIHVFRSVHRPSTWNSRGCCSGSRANAVQRRAPGQKHRVVQEPVHEPVRGNSVDTMLQLRR
jgi:hypothetical protein